MQTVDRVEIRLQPFDARRLHGFFVHAGSIVVTNLLHGGIPAGSGRSRFFENPPQSSCILILHFVPRDPARLVWRNGILLHPAAAGAVSYTHLDVYKRQQALCVLYSSTESPGQSYAPADNRKKL